MIAQPREQGCESESAVADSYTIMKEIRVTPSPGQTHEDAVKAMYSRAYERWGGSLRTCDEIERALQKKFRYPTMSRMMKALADYQLLSAGDRVAIAISGGKDSLMLAKLFQALHAHTRVPFDVEYFAMDPGYARENRELLEFNCAWLNIPVKIYNSDVFSVADSLSSNPCYLCARMRRGFLYAKAEALGCNKVALGHHFNDVIETTMLNVLWSANYKNMMPKLNSQNFEGMTLIRPLFLVEEENIIAWRDYAGLSALDCACTVTRREEGSQRKQIKALIKMLKQTNPNVEKSIFRSGQNVALDAIMGFTCAGKRYDFQDFFGKDEWKL